MKLKCSDHGRRVMLLEPSGKVVHRTGDGSKCDSKKIGFKSETTPSLNKEFTPEEFLNQAHLQNA